MDACAHVDDLPVLTPSSRDCVCCRALAAGQELRSRTLIRATRGVEVRTRDVPGLRDLFLLEASVLGIFAAGDVRHDVIRRVASAVGQGSVAVSLVHKYLETV